MSDYSTINILINKLGNTLKINDNKKLFFIVTNCYLISKIRTKKDNGDDILKQVYPYIFEENLIDYDSPECLSLIEAFSNKYDTDIIGYLYELSIPQKERKDLGQFYTRSNNIVDYMTGLCDFDYNTSILEPSSGSGLFIINIIKNILDHTSKNDLEKVLINIFSNVSANDCDELACKITEINILVTTINYIKKVLEINPSFILPKLNITCMDFCYYNVTNKYNLIISNPPYVTMYGRRSRNMTEEKRAYFNTFDFVLNKKGNNKFNLIMFFIEKGLKALKENGKLVFIVDISFFETAFIDIRKYILENCFIESITTNLSEFKDVASGQVIISLIKNKELASSSLTKWIDYKNQNVIEINQNIWYDSKNNYKIFVPLSDLEKDINDKINSFDSLDKFFPGKALRTCCALTGRTDDFLVDKNKSTANIIFPYLEGSKGVKNKFAMPTSSKYIEYNYDLQIEISNQFKEELEKLGVKNKKRVTLGDKDAYLSPKIFIRQSANDIIATYTDKPFAANNSLYVMTNKKNDSESIKILKYVCGILNSDLITFYSRINNIIRRGVGKTPQIKTSDLKKIRIAYNKDKIDDIANLVDNSLQEFTKEKRTELNNSIYKLYNISNEEIDYINNYLKKDDV